MPEIPDSQPLKPIEDEKMVEAIIDAISSLTADDVWTGNTADALDELSSATSFEGIEANPEGIFSADNGHTFEAACTIYVTLNYGGSRDHVSMADSYPATVSGSFDDDGRVSIDHVAVDTSSFFGPEE